MGADSQPAVSRSRAAVRDLVHTAGRTGRRVGRSGDPPPCSFLPRLVRSPPGCRWVRPKPSPRPPRLHSRPPAGRPSPSPVTLHSRRVWHNIGAYMAHSVTRWPSARPFHTTGSRTVGSGFIFPRHSTVGIRVRRIEGADNKETQCAWGSEGACTQSIRLCPYSARQAGH